MGRRSIVKTDKASVIISVSLQYKQYDNLWEIQHENAEWYRAIIDLCCFTIHISSLALCKCVYYTLLKVRGQCLLRFWWHLCLWMWPTMNVVIIFRGTGWMQAEWSLSTAVIGVDPLKLLHNILPPATLHWHSLLSLSMIISGFDSAHGFWCLSLLHGHVVSIECV